jgi:hypothetical protein
VIAHVERAVTDQPRRDDRGGKPCFASPSVASAARHRTSRHAAGTAPGYA